MTIMKTWKKIACLETKRIGSDFGALMEVMTTLQEFKDQKLGERMEDVSIRGGGMEDILRNTAGSQDDDSGVRVDRARVRNSKNIRQRLDWNIRECPNIRGVCGYNLLTTRIISVKDMENSSGPIGVNGVGGGVKRCWSARAGSWIRSSQHSRSIGTMCAARRTERLEIAVLKLQSVFTEMDQDLVTNFDMLRLLEEKGRSENSQEEHTIMKSNTEVWNQLNETQATVIEEEQGEAMEVAEDDETWTSG